ncbi:hypothetical protein QR680_001679 [Steinernema hermaphroditum]|uniref:Uncharacterized protein n=1 Tax=Steinernema hermaphroditum TaxID=289476 RepID=A0AA39H0Z9_9BILA|nr:hypothetical protein QR680_001679 [Steinernema hermaphroditum]
MTEFRWILLSPKARRSCESCPESRDWLLTLPDPTVVFVPKAKLLEAKNLLNLYRNHQEPVGTTLSDLYRAQKM